MRRVARPRSRLFKRAYSRSRSAAAKRRKSTYNAPAVSVRSSIPLRTGFGTRRKVTLLYQEDATNVGGVAAGALGIYQFRLNSAYDPNATGVGHQPLGFDQISALYEKYVILGCKYDVRFFNISGSQDVIVGYQVSDNGSAASWPTVYEQGCGEWKVVSRLGNQPYARFTGYARMAKVQGQSEAAYVADDTNIGLVTGNPSDSVWLSCYCKEMTSGTSPTVYMWVTLEMECLFIGASQTPAS